MTIIDGSLNLAQLQALKRADLNGRITASFVGLSNQLKLIFDLIWTDLQLTPQQVFDCFGVDAASLFQMAAIMTTALNEIKPNSIDLTPPYNYTINDDGTVTVGAAK